MNLVERVTLISKYQELLSKYNDPLIKEVFDACSKYILYEETSLSDIRRWLHYFQDDVAMQAWIDWEKLPCHFLDNKVFAKTPDDYGRVSVIAEYFESNPELIKDKAVMDFGAGSSALALKLKRLGAKSVTVVDITHYVAIDTAFTNIKYNTPIKNKFQINHNFAPSDIDVVIASGIFDEGHVWWLLNWNFVNRCEMAGKEIYVCSQRILKGEHPYIKPVEPNILYEKNGISIFNKIGNFEVIIP